MPPSAERRAAPKPAAAGLTAQAWIAWPAVGIGAAIVLLLVVILLLVRRRKPPPASPSA